MGKSNTVWIKVEVLRRSKFDNGWEIETDDGTKAWVNDDRIVDSEDDLKVGAYMKIELSTGYAEAMKLA